MGNVIIYINITFTWIQVKYFKSVIKHYYNQWRIIQNSSGVCFHAVHSNDLAIYKSKFHSLNINQFIKEVNRLKKFSKILPIEEYIDQVSDTNRKKGISTITFDDAYKGLLKDAIPFLLSESIPFTIFVNSITLHNTLLWRDQFRSIMDSENLQKFVKQLSKTDLAAMFENGDLYKVSKQPHINSKLFHAQLMKFGEENNLPAIDRNVYMSINDLIELQKKGIKIGNHTQNHYVLSSLSNNEQKHEIVHGRKDLESVGLNVVDVFAAPFGGYNTINQFTVDLLLELGYCGLLLTNGYSKVNKKLLPEMKGLTVMNRFLP